MDFVAAVLVSFEGLVTLLFAEPELELYETLTQYEEVKKKVLDWQERK